VFTGIVEELGHVVRLEAGAASARLTVQGPLVMSDAQHGSSIAVNGVCLTVVDLAGDAFTADVMLQTLRFTALGDLAAGDRVNLERPLAANGRFGGHVVQGHVDGAARVLERTAGERWETVRIELPPSLAPYLVAQGSVALDGVSLTVAGMDDAVGSFTVALIPQTLARTTLGRRRPGERVNLEVDVLAKYVQRLLRPVAEVTPGQAQLERLIEAEGVRR
jgi:riboflavin synthase